LYNIKIFDRFWKIELLLFCFTKDYGVDLLKPFCLAYKKEFGTSPQNVFRGLAQGSCTQNKNFSDFYSQTLILALIEYQGGVQLVMPGIGLVLLTRHPLAHGCSKSF
jgi:hypothetical protein